jgi:hypothetical protein
MVKRSRGKAGKTTADGGMIGSTFTRRLEAEVTGGGYVRIELSGADTRLFVTLASAGFLTVTTGSMYTNEAVNVEISDPETLVRFGRALIAGAAAAGPESILYNL